MSIEGDTLAGSNKAAWADDIDYTKQGATCRHCGYLLRELKEDRCPECGTVFDRHDPRTMKVPRLRNIPRETIFGEQMITASLLATIYWVFAVHTQPLLCVAGAAAWLAIGLRWRWRNNLPANDPWWRWMPEGPKWRPFVKVMILISILGTCHFHSCPHATTVWLGPYGLSYSSNGGPCHNSPHGGGEKLVGNLYIAS